jgi:hypothetical protein
MRPIFLATILAACSGGMDLPDVGGHDGDTAPLPDARASVDARPAADAPPGDSGATTAHDRPLVQQCATAPVATAPPATWVNVTHNLAGMTSECGNLTMISAQPCSNGVIAGVARQGLWRTTDGGATWVHIGTRGDAILHRPTDIVYDPAHPGTFYEAGIYGWETPWSQGVFRTTDDGATFTGYMSISVVQSSQDSVGVDFFDPARAFMVAGGHEQRQFFFVSNDAGANWTNVGAAIPDSVGFCTTALVLDRGAFLLGCAASWSNHAGAVLRTTNAGASFTQVSNVGVVGRPLWASNGAIYWAREGGGMLRSTDLGRTWTPSADGAQVRAPPIELPDGRLLSRNGDHVVVSRDGATWTPVGNALPVDGGVTYSAQTKTLYLWRNDCGNRVLADAVWAAGWDYTR